MMSAQLPAALECPLPIVDSLISSLWNSPGSPVVDKADMAKRGGGRAVAWADLKFPSLRGRVRPWQR